MYATTKIAGSLDNKPFSYSAGERVDPAHVELLKLAGLVTATKPKATKEAQK